MYSVGDLATWVGVIFAFLFSAAALVVSLVSLRYQRISAQAAKASQTQATRSADAAEEAAESSARSAEAADRSAVAAEQLTEIETVRDMQRTVAWAVDRESQFAAHLRNAGAETVTGVTVDATMDGVNEAPDGVTLAPGESARVMISSSMNFLSPRHLRVKWDGRAEWVNVPIPPW